MARLEEIEMARYANELEDDMRHIVNKYCRIMSWEVPELDEREARRLILDATQKSLDKVSKE
jgi:hypothetical protein